MDGVPIGAIATLPPDLAGALQRGLARKRDAQSAADQAESLRLSREQNAADDNWDALQIAISSDRVATEGLLHYADLHRPRSWSAETPHYLLVFRIPALAPIAIQFERRGSHPWVRAPWNNRPGNRFRVMGYCLGPTGKAEMSTANATYHTCLEDALAAAYEAQAVREQIEAGIAP